VWCSGHGFGLRCLHRELHAAAYCCTQPHCDCDPNFVSDGVGPIGDSLCLANSVGVRHRCGSGDAYVVCYSHSVTLGRVALKDPVSRIAICNTKSITNQILDWKPIAYKIPYWQPVTNQITDPKSFSNQIADPKSVSNQIPNWQPIADRVPHWQPIADQTPHWQPIADRVPHWQPIADRVPHWQPITNTVPVGQCVSVPVTQRQPIVNTHSHILLYQQSLHVWGSDRE
jgi:hypothetical protein